MLLNFFVSTSSLIFSLEINNLRTTNKQVQNQECNNFILLFVVCVYISKQTTQTNFSLMNAIYANNNGDRWTTKNSVRTNRTKKKEITKIEKIKKTDTATNLHHIHSDMRIAIESQNAENKKEKQSIGYKFFLFVIGTPYWEQHETIVNDLLKWFILNHEMTWWDWIRFPFHRIWLNFFITTWLDYNKNNCITWINEKGKENWEETKRDFVQIFFWLLFDLIRCAIHFRSIFSQFSAHVLLEWWIFFLIDSHFLLLAFNHILFMFYSKF